MWNRHTGEQRITLTGHTGRVWGVVVTPNGEEIVTAGRDGTARVWHRHTGEQRITLTGHTGRVAGVTVSADGEEIVTAGRDGTARVWHRRTGEQRITLTGHTGPVWGVVVTPDGEEIVTAGDDGTARVWHRRTGEQRITLIGHTGVVVTPDGEEIVTADGRIDRDAARRTGANACRSTPFWQAVRPGHLRGVTGGASAPAGQRHLPGGVPALMCRMQAARRPTGSARCARRATIVP